MRAAKQGSVVDAVESLLKETSLSTQEELRLELSRMGFDVTQSTVSRALKKLGAIRAYNEENQAYYALPNDESLPSVTSTVMDLVLDVVHNENLVVVSTKPGSASLIARHVDHGAETVIGTVAGDDCFLVIPKSAKKIQETLDEVYQLIGWRE